MGNYSTKNLKPIRTHEDAVAKGRAGQKKATETRRRRKSIAEALKAILYAKSDIDPKKLVVDDVVSNIVVKMLTNPDARDLKIIAELLGELSQKIEVEADVKAKAELFKLPDGE